RLGGSREESREAVVAVGGLHVVGTGRHSTERLDNQLRGRAGRQGDPGSSLFFSSLEDSLVTGYLGDSKLPKEAGNDGLIINDRIGAMLDHAQRVSEGAMLDVHANTWRYNQLMAQQRNIIGSRRSTILLSDQAKIEMKKFAPERYSKLSENFSEEYLEQAARLIMLYHLDRGWAEHLAYLADVRESIHLRALGRQNPLDEFHRLAVDSFTSLAADAIESSVQTFETAAIAEEGLGINLSGLKRPTSTWTYMIHDNPFASGSGGALEGIAGIFR
ncbi:MAG: accessory Sec system translocase SecA2, partial [Mycobacteriaceae bacterium]